MDAQTAEGDTVHELQIIRDADGTSIRITPEIEERLGITHDRTIFASEAGMGLVLMSDAMRLAGEAAGRYESALADLGR